MKDDTKITKDIEEASVSTNMILTEWQTAFENFNKIIENIGNQINQIEENQALRAIGVLVNQIRDTLDISVSNLKSIINIPEDYKTKTKYIKNLKYLEWPLFLLQDAALVALINERCDDKTLNLEALKDEILEYLTIDYIIDLSQKWANNKVVSDERKAAIYEAVKLFEKEYYYGCTALLTCQLEGVITDTYKKHTCGGNRILPEDINAVYGYFNPEKKINNVKQIKKEKDQLLAVASEIDSNIIVWEAVVGYIYKTIFTSDEKMNQSMHPCRNKICHGVQLNYGTREHAVKAILVVDMLFKLGEELNK